MSENDPAADVDVRHLINAQTGRIGWPELQRHFARGLVLWVAPDLDLVEVAACIVNDDKTEVSAWLERGKLIKPDLEMAKGWQQDEPQFWAVVAAPWVLVQESREGS
jgi:hypothetical protein